MGDHRKRVDFDIANYRGHFNFDTYRDEGSDLLTVTIQCVVTAKVRYESRTIDKKTYNEVVSPVNGSIESGYSNMGITSTKDSEGKWIYSHEVGVSYFSQKSFSFRVGEAAGYVEMSASYEGASGSARVPYDSKGTGDFASLPDAYYGEEQTVGLKIYSSTNLFKLRVKKNDNIYYESDYLFPGVVTDNYTVTIPYTDTGFVDLFADNSEIEMTMEEAAYNSEKTLLSTHSATFKLKLRENETSRPEINLLEIIGMDPVFNDFIIGSSKPIFKFVLTPKFFATISSASLSYGGYIYRCDLDTGTTERQEVAFETTTVETDSDEWKNWSISVVDSRGFTATQTGSIELTNYTEPQISNMTFAKQGTTIQITADYKFSEILNNNVFKYRIAKVKVSTGVVTVLKGDTVLTESTGTISFTEVNDDVESATYEYQICLEDKRSTVMASKKTGITCLSLYRGGKGAAFFKSAEKGDNTLEVNGILETTRLFVNGNEFGQNKIVEISKDDFSSIAIPDENTYYYIFEEV